MSYVFVFSINLVKAQRSFLDSLCKRPTWFGECSLTLNHPCIYLTLNGMSNKFCAASASLARDTSNHTCDVGLGLGAISSQKWDGRCSLKRYSFSLSPFHLQPSCPTLTSYRCILSPLLLLPPHSPITLAKAPFLSSWTGKGVGSQRWWTTQNRASLFLSSVPLVQLPFCSCCMLLSQPIDTRISPTLSATTLRIQVG